MPLSNDMFGLRVTLPDGSTPDLSPGMIVTRLRGQTWSDELLTRTVRELERVRQWDDFAVQMAVAELDPTGLLWVRLKGLKTVEV